MYICVYACHCGGGLARRFSWNDDHWCAAATRPVLVLDRDDGDDAAAPGALTRVDSDEWV
eukprot:m.432929 g.432929  ORF g.432929 m.432929 type:complete len:60 (+) comp21415_c0_seq10:2274-2453(+)